MGKFSNFENYLLNNKKDQFVFSFSEIERIIGQSLCYSAYHYQEYWSPSGHAKCLGGVISDCGYLVEQVDLSRKIIYLKRGR